MASYSPATPVQIQKDLESAQADLEFRENQFFWGVIFAPPKDNVGKSVPLCLPLKLICIFSIFIWAVGGMLQLI